MFPRPVDDPSQCNHAVPACLQILSDLPVYTIEHHRKLIVSSTADTVVDRVRQTRAGVIIF